MALNETPEYRLNRVSCNLKDKPLGMVRLQ